MTILENGLRVRRKEEQKHFMVDCETLGLMPNSNPVLQLAIVEFDFETLKATGNQMTIFFPLVEQIQNGAEADKGTVEWWNKQNQDVLKHIMDGVNSAGSMKDQLDAVTRWVTKCCLNPNGSMYRSVFWAKPVGFDFPFVDGLFQRYKAISPFHFRNVVDMSTYIISNFNAEYKHKTNGDSLDFWLSQQLYWNAMNLVKEENANETINAHDATNDCHFQIKWLNEAIFNSRKYLDLLDILVDK